MTNTHFGFKTIDASQKASAVGSIFSSVASRYDVMNDAMSFGIHRLWKRAMIDQLSLRPHMKLLDVAGGTGDITLLALRREPTLHVTMTDINPDMLAAGKARILDSHGALPIEFTVADAEQLPFTPQSFDRVSIAFGIRNVTHIERALASVFSALKPGGKFVCLEFSKPCLPWLERVYDTYSFNVIPKLGEIIGKDKAAYQYLVESIRMFPTQDQFASMLKNAGFTQVKYTNLTGGIVAIHSGIKI
jgi:demethylmenaquinone methyltransferase/2-methoxy-6-polyprenyl-1,4-benzoquinol methylase